MAGKDIVTKKLVGLYDVFADILNGFLFNGEQKVKEDELTDLPLKTIYSSDGMELREQERDVFKLWKKKGVVFSLVGIENQTKPDKDMALRVLSYDGASYRSQLTNKSDERYPVVTLVMYYGEGKWNAPLNLKERISVPPEIDMYVNDYKINVINICDVEVDKIEKFKSDYGQILKFLSGKTEVKNNNHILKHPYEVLRFFVETLGDKRFESIKDNFSFEKEEVSMVGIWDKIEAEGMRKGLEQGRSEGKLEGKLEGEREVEAKLAALGKAMMADGRSDEVFEILVDKNKREELYKKYKITD